MVRARVLASVFGIIALVSVLVAPAPRVAMAANSAGIVFEAPSVVDPMHAMGEPDIGVDPLGRVFSSGPTGTGTQRSLWYGSVDKGHTYREINPGTPPAALSGTKDAPGGGDTDIAFDRSSKQYFADLYALTCLRTATTNDGGATANQEIYPAGCSGVPGADRQWLAVFDPGPAQRASTKSAYLKAGGPTPLIYMEYNNLANGAHWVKSNIHTLPQVPGDPGLTYQDATNGDTSPCTDLNGNVGFYAPFGADGHPSIDQLTGNVFQAEFGSSVNGKASILLNIGTPDAAGNLTFLDAPSTAFPCGDQSKLITVATGVPDDSGDAANFVVSAIDSASNLYVAWVGKSKTPALRQAFVSAASPASGYRNWTTVQVSDASTATGDAANVFPWVAAGGPGRSDVVWYGANQFTDPSTNNGQAWNVFMAQAVFNTDQGGNVITATPIVSLVKASPHPSHYDSICLAGTGCISSQGNRNLADFFAVTIDGSGAAEIVYDDTSNGLVQPDFTPANKQLLDHAGAPVVTVVRQSAGIGLYGTAVSGPPNSPVSGLNDPAGDASYPVIGGANQRGMDIRSSALRLSPDGKTLTVSMQVVDLRNPGLTASALAATNLQYLTRWQMGNTIYYAAMENTAANRPIFYAGKANSIDLCSVSACFPHVLTYPEPPPANPSPGTNLTTYTGTSENGSVICPATPSASNPCVLTIQVATADIGGPTSTSLLEEVGGYALAAATQEGQENNATALADTVPLEIDGVCCYNFQASINNGGPPACHEADGDGDVSDGRGGKAHVRFDQDACEDGAPEGVQEGDTQTGDNFQSNNVSAMTFDDGLGNLTIFGTGTHNGSPVSFTLVAVSGTAGVGSFNLVLSDGYAVNGTLLSGSIQLQ